MLPCETFVPTLSPNVMPHTPFLLSGVVFAGLLVSTAGCASLTDSQRKSVADYAKITQTYTQYPGQIATSYADLNYAVEQIRLATPVSATLISRGMEQNNEARDRVLHEAQRIDSGIRTVRAYAQALEALSATTIPTSFGKNAEVLGTNLDDLAKAYNKQGTGASPLPVGFGVLAGEVIAEAGKAYINQRQAAALRAFMSQGDVLLRTITGDTQTAIQTFRQNRGDGLRSHLASYHSKLLSQLTAQTAGRAYYIYEVNKDVANLLDRITALETLTTGVQNSVATLYEAHHSVLVDILQKRSAKQQIADLKSLYQSARSLDEQYQILVNANRPKP